MKAIFWILGALAVVAALFKWGAPSQVEVGAASRKEEATFAARRGDLKISVVEQGALKAKNNVEIVPGFNRWSTITKLVPEGKEVKQDEVLAEFDKTELETQVEEMANSLITLNTELESSKAELEIQRRDNLAAVEAAEFNHKKALMNIDKYEKGDRPNDLRKAQLGAEKARSEFERKKEQFERVPELEREGFLTKIQVEEERIQLREYELTAESADKSLELFLLYTDPMQRAELENAQKDTERVLTNAKERANIQLKEKEVRVQNAEGKIKSTEARLKKLREQLGKMTVKAPRDGIVLYGDPNNEWMRREIKVGANWGGDNTLFTLPDLREMQLVVKIHEADISLVKKEMDALVTVESFKGRTFKGKVTEIASTASDEWGMDARRFRCEITIEPFTDVEMRAGTTAKAEIQVEELKDVLHVPIHAVVAEEGDHFCFVPKAEGFEKRTVKIGKNNLHYVEVLDGLKEGELVLLYDPRSSGSSSERKADETKTSPAEAMGASSAKAASKP